MMMSWFIAMQCHWYYSGYQFAWTEDDSLVAAITGSSSFVKPLLMVWDTDKREFYPLQNDSELTAKLITTFLLDVSKQKIKPQVAATNYLDLLENFISMTYGVCWTMYVHRPLMTLGTVIMLLLGLYLFLCVPKKPDKKPRPRRNKRSGREKNATETISPDTTDDEPRRRNVNRTSDNNDPIEDAHSN